MKRAFLISSALVFLAGCSATTANIGSLILPTSLKKIDVVQHRSSSVGCVELVVIQTYSDIGTLLDAREGRGQSLPCLLTGTVIEAGSRVGSAAIIARGMVNAAKATKPDNIDINQFQIQGQKQHVKGNEGGDFSDNTCDGGSCTYTDGGGHGEWDYE